MKKGDVLRESAVMDTYRREHPFCECDDETLIDSRVEDRCLWHVFRDKVQLHRADYDHALKYSPADIPHIEKRFDDADWLLRDHERVMSRRIMKQREDASADARRQRQMEDEEVEAWLAAN